MEAIICGIDIKARSNHDFFLISIHINNPEGQEEATWVGWGCSNFTWKKWKQNRIYLLDWSLNKNIGWFRNIKIVEYFLARTLEIKKRIQLRNSQLVLNQAI